MPMPLSPRRLVFWTTAFIAVGTWFVLPDTSSSTLPAAQPAPWIPLPSSGMDASRAPVRDLLSSSLPDIDTFASACGHDDDGRPERYLMTEIREGWKNTHSIEFLPSDETVDVMFRQGVLQSPSIDAASDVDPPVGRLAHTRLSRPTAEPIRRLWNTRLLWHAEQSAFGCSHGGMAILQACVRGRYAIRLRDCGPEITAARAALWEAATSSLAQVGDSGRSVPRLDPHVMR